MAYHTLEVVFTTTQQQYAVPGTPFSLLSSVGRTELNALINELLKENQPDWQVVEFDFLINHEFLRATLETHLGPTAGEGKVDIEYLESLPAPDPQDCLEHDDWVSAVQARDKWILSGCYDNSLHIWSSKGTHKIRIPAHEGPVKGVAWLENEGSVASFVSASCDQTAKIWTWDMRSNKAKCKWICRGHERSLTSVSVSPNNKLMATGSWDCLLKIWSTDLEQSITDQDEAPVKKIKEKYPTRMPVLTLKGHQGVVSSTVWTEVNEICTASWDHTLRLWDAEVGAVKLDAAFNKPFFDVDTSEVNRTLLSASSDRHIRLHDLRSQEFSVVKTTFTNHSKLVTSVRWSKTEENLFASGSHDHDVKLWDRRSFRTPLYNLSAHEDQVLCCDWSKPDCIVSGGVDKKVHIFNLRNIKNQENIS